MADYVLIAGGLKRGGNGRFLQDTSYSSFAFDAVESIQFKYSATPTKHAVDSKASVSDHMIQENDTFTLTVVVSDTPVERHDNNQISYGAGSTRKKRSAEALSKLKVLKESGSVVTLATEFDVITNCVIKSISGTLTGANINAYPIQIDLEKVRIASVDSVLLIADSSIVDSVTGAVSSGSADKKDETENTQGDFILDDLLERTFTRDQQVTE